MAADKPVAPAGLFQVSGAGGVVWEKALELWERLWELKISVLMNVHEHSRTLALVAVGDNRIGMQWTTYRYQWLSDVPLRGDAEAINVNWFSIGISDDGGTVTYRNSFITDMPVHRANVADMAAAGRTRWKIENEAFNTLKTNGYNLEHNFGHGQQHLSSVLATLNLLAFACHTVCDLADKPWRAARRELVTRQGFFHTMVALTKYLVFSCWDHLLGTMAFARPPSLAP
jgi:hypothetical protein